MPLLVRRVKVEDMPRVELLASDEAKRFAARGGWLSTARRQLEKALSDEPQGILLADYDGRVVGVAVVRHQGTHPVSGLRHGTLQLLVVAQGWRTQGVAARLLREAEAYCKARGAEVLTLQLPADAGEDADVFKESGYQVAGWELERSLK